MSTNEAADPVEFAKRVHGELSKSNSLWSGFNLWSATNNQLHSLLSGMAILLAGEEIVYATSAIAPEKDSNNSSYLVTIFTARHVLTAVRGAGEEQPRIKLISRNDLHSIEVLSSPITTTSTIDLWAAAPDQLTVRLGYPSLDVDLIAHDHRLSALQSLIPSLMADLDA